MSVRGDARARLHPDECGHGRALVVYEVELEADARVRGRSPLALARANDEEARAARLCLRLRPRAAPLGFRLRLRAAVVRRLFRDEREQARACVGGRGGFGRGEGEV